LQVIDRHAGTQRIEARGCDGLDKGFFQFFAEEFFGGHDGNYIAEIMAGRRREDCTRRCGTASYG
jgi:hypothetical protein